MKFNKIFVILLVFMMLLQISYGITNNCQTADCQNGGTGFNNPYIAPGDYFVSIDGNTVTRKGNPPVSYTNEGHGWKDPSGNPLSDNAGNAMDEIVIQNNIDLKNFIDNYNKEVTQDIRQDSANDRADNKIDNMGGDESGVTQEEEDAARRQNSEKSTQTPPGGLEGANYKGSSPDLSNVGEEPSGNMPPNEAPTSTPEDNDEDYSLPSDSTNPNNNPDTPSNDGYEIASETKANNPNQPTTHTDKNGVVWTETVNGWVSCGEFGCSDPMLNEDFQKDVIDRDHEENRAEAFNTAASMMDDWSRAINDGRSWGTLAQNEGWWDGEPWLGDSVMAVAEEHDPDTWAKSECEMPYDPDSASSAVVTDSGEVAFILEASKMDASTYVTCYNEDDSDNDSICEETFEGFLESVKCDGGICVDDSAYGEPVVFEQNRYVIESILSLSSEVWDSNKDEDDQRFKLKFFVKDCMEDGLDVNEDGAVNESDNLIYDHGDSGFSFVGSNSLRFYKHTDVDDCIKACVRFEDMTETFMGFLGQLKDNDFKDKHDVDDLSDGDKEVCSKFKDTPDDSQPDTEDAFKDGNINPGGFGNIFPD